MAASAGSVNDVRHSDSAQARRRRRLPFWAEIPLLVLAACAVVVIVQGFLLRVFVVPSGSMQTTLIGCPGCTNDRILAEKIGPKLGPLAPGEIVVFRGPPSWTNNEEVSGASSRDGGKRFLEELSAWSSLSTPGEKDFVKRIIAVGGETVACCDRGRVTVDGRPLAEAYVHLQAGGPSEQQPFAPTTLAPGQLWVMGDNRNNSSDSRQHGPVSSGDVIGKARAIVYPLDRWRTLPRVDGR